MISIFKRAVIAIKIPVDPRSFIDVNVSVQLGVVSSSSENQIVEFRTWLAKRKSVIAISSGSKRINRPSSALNLPTVHKVSRSHWILASGWNRWRTMLPMSMTSQSSASRPSITAWESFFHFLPLWSFFTYSMTDLRCRKENPVPMTR